MKRVFIIHGWDANPKLHWYPWLKKKLEDKGFKVVVPQMPSTSEPKIDSWISHLKKLVGQLDNETYFVGHSIGCQTIMRFLENDDYNGKIGKSVFVAGWFDLNNLEDEKSEEIADPWINTPLNFKIIRGKMPRLSVFLSSDEPYNCIEENKRIFEKELGAKVIVLESRGHFTKEDGIGELPEVLREFSTI